MVPSASHLEAGPGPKAIVLPDQNGIDVRLGPFICYEDILPRYVRETANQGVHLFVNLTNDAWFGKTHEPWQHLGLGVFRAVEHRKGLARAVNTGVSAYVDPTGRIVEALEVTDPDVDGRLRADGFVAEVPLMDPETQTLYGSPASCSTSCASSASRSSTGAAADSRRRLARDGSLALDDCGAARVGVATKIRRLRQRHRLPPRRRRRTRRPRPSPPRQPARSAPTPPPSASPHRCSP